MLQLAQAATLICLCAVLGQVLELFQGGEGTVLGTRILRCLQQVGVRVLDLHLILPPQAPVRC